MFKELSLKLKKFSKVRKITKFIKFETEFLSHSKFSRELSTEDHTVLATVIDIFDFVYRRGLQRILSMA